MSRNESFDIGANDHEYDLRPGEEPFESPSEADKAEMDRIWERRGKIQEKLSEGGFTPRAARLPYEDVPAPKNERPRLRKELAEQDAPYKEGYESGIEEGKAQVTQQEVKKALKQVQAQKRAGRSTMAQARSFGRLARMARGRRR